MSERGTVEVDVDELDLDQDDEMTAIEYAERIQKVLNALPPDQRKSVKLKVTGEWAFLRCTYKRPETDAEMAKRISRCTERTREDEQRERKWLRELLTKYPDEKS